MPDPEALEITMIIAAADVVLITAANVEARLLRQPQAEIKLESINLSDEE